jgi:uncharacterized membrane protein YcaP (DUF421 family)
MATAVAEFWENKFRRVERFADGEPTFLVAKGRMLTRNFSRERISLEKILWPDAQSEM